MLVVLEMYFRHISLFFVTFMGIGGTLSTVVKFYNNSFTVQFPSYTLVSVLLVLASVKLPLHPIYIPYQCYNDKSVNPVGQLLISPVLFASNTMMSPNGKI